MLPEPFAILDSVSALVLAFDAQGRVSFANRAFYELFGYTPDDILARTPDEFLVFYRENPAIIEAQTVAAHGISGWKTHSGEVHTISWTSQIWQNPASGDQFAIFTGVDQSERQQIEKLLEREQRLLRSLIDSIPDLIFYKDTQGVYLGCNKAFEQFSGRSVAEIASGRSDADFYSPELAEKFLQSDRSVLEKRESLRYENWRNSSDGETILIETHKTPYIGPNGEMLGVIGVGRDITRHRMAEEALRKTNAEIEQLIASLSSILIVLSADFTVLRWNPMAEKIFGLGPKAAIGQPMGTLAISWDWPAVKTALLQCCAESRPVYLDPMRFRRPNGSEGYIGINVSPMQEEDGRLNGYIVLGADITERKILENRLSQAQKLESIGQLAAGVAHEINTPIQYVGDNVHFLQTGFAALLGVLEGTRGILFASQEGAPLDSHVENLRQSAAQADLAFLSAEIPTAIQQSLEGIERVSSIVRAMKEFSHPGIKQKTALDINRALENTLTVTRNEWKYVAELETDFDPTLPTVMCLPGEINQVFLNIIVNAADAIKEVTSATGKGKITLQTRRNGDWVEVRISDSGGGVPVEIADRIFEPFFTTKAVGKGSGQGLAIAYDVIAVKHQGTLTFETMSGRGTTFIIRLPIG